ncbi:MAG: DUF6444 domain-containing protein [Candidatus Tectimicrobiota bacterium]
MQSLVQRVAVLEARLQQDSRTSHRPPSTDSPYQKGRKYRKFKRPFPPPVGVPSRHRDLPRLAPVGSQHAQARAAGHGPDGSLGTGSRRRWGCCPLGLPRGGLPG